MSIDPNKAVLMAGRRLCLFDVIEHKKEHLIVALWYANPAAKLRQPKFVIPLSSVSHLVNDTDPKFPRYVVNGVFPESIFLGTASRNERRRYGVRQGPEITLPMPEIPTRH